MRNFQTLDQVSLDESTGILTIADSSAAHITSQVCFRREGSYIAVSASYGPLEIAMRLRFPEFARVLSRLRPVKGLQTTRQIGSAQAFIGVGLQSDGGLVMRPTIVADATGYMNYNLLLSEEVRQRLFDWLPVPQIPID